MQYEDYKACAERVSELLADPVRVMICPECLADCACALTSREATYVPRLRQDCQQLFDRCVLLFLTPRTPDEVLRLQNAPVMCCAPEHSQAKAPAVRRLGLALDAAEAIVSLGLHAGPQSPAARALNTLKSFASRSGRWPARLEQLLPFGAEKAVKQLVELAELRIAAGPLAMLTHCIIMARAAVLPVVLSDGHRSRLVTVLRRSLTMDPKKCKWSGDPRTVVAAFVDGVFRGPGALPRDFELLVAGAELELYRAVRDAVSGAPDTLHGLEALTDLCTKLYLMLGARAPDAGAVPQLPARAQKELRETARPMSRASAYALLVHALIRQAGLATRCAAPGCAASALHGGDRAKFPVCSRCRLLRYCSKACQARAWTDAGGPHKALCAVLCKFDAHQYVHSPAGSFDDQYARVLPQLSDDEVQVFNAWLTACRDEFGTLSEIFVGPVDVRGVDPFGMKSYAWLALGTLCAIVLAFSSLSFAWAVLVTLLSVGFTLWRLAQPFLMLRNSGIIQ